jgi:5-methylcytosine-specific restriction endonuclease McrA
MQDTGGISPEFDTERRWVSAADTDDGMVRITAQLHADEAAMVMAAVEQAGTTPTSFDRADGLVALAVGTGCSGTENTQSPLPSPSHSPSLSSSIDMVVRVDADTLIGRSTQPAVMGCTNVSAETARRLLCNAAVIPFRVDSDGDVLDIGHRSRAIPPKMRLAMLARDDFHCRFPGCAHTSFLDGHHVLHWENGGPTKLDNLVTLCTAHHRTVHELGFYVERHHDRFVFFDPNGEAIG